jgi:hypothetical protein
MAGPFEWRCIFATDRSIRQNENQFFLKSEILTDGEIKIFSDGI